MTGLSRNGTNLAPGRIDWVAQPQGPLPQWFAWTDTPLGRALLIADAEALTGLHFEQQRHMPQIRSHWIQAPDHAVLRLAREQLDEYCAGQRLAFELPLRLYGTAFQLAVWQSIAAIAAGSSLTYRLLAAAAGNPAAVRAAGAATGRNPISVIVPCHRVLGSDGTLTGYAGGLHRKRALLAFEAAACAGQCVPLARFVQPELALGDMPPGSLQPGRHALVA